MRGVRRLMRRPGPERRAALRKVWFVSCSIFLLGGAIAGAAAGEALVFIGGVVASVYFAFAAFSGGDSDGGGGGGGCGGCGGD